MVFSCVLCLKETCYVHNFCETCEFIKRVCNIYGADEVKNILDRVCIRNTEQRNYKIATELKNEICNVVKEKEKEKKKVSKNTVGC